MARAVNPFTEAAQRNERIDLKFVCLLMRGAIELSQSTAARAMQLYGLHALCIGFYLVQ